MPGKAKNTWNRPVWTPLAVKVGAVVRCIAALQASPCFAEDTGITHLPRTQLLYYQYS